MSGGRKSFEEQRGFIIHQNQKAFFGKRRAFMAALESALCGFFGEPVELPEDDFARCVYDTIMCDNERDKKAYDEACRRNRQNAKSRWKDQPMRPHPTASDRMRPHATDANIIELSRTENPREGIAHTREGKPELRQVLNTATTTMGVPEYYARWWYAEMEARGWLNTDGTSVWTRNWRPTLKAWYNREDQKHLAEIRNDQTAGEKREIVVSAKDWLLCAERCANCQNGCGCQAGIRIPPSKDPDHPHPPEECKSFARL